MIKLNEKARNTNRGERLDIWRLRIVLVVFLALAGQAALAEGVAQASKEASEPDSMFTWGGKNSVAPRGHYVNDVDGINSSFRAMNEFCVNLDAVLETGSDPKLCYFGTNEGGWIDGESFYFGDQVVRFHIEQFPEWLDLIGEFETDSVVGLVDRRGGIRIYLPLFSYGYSELTFSEKTWKAVMYASWELPFMPGQWWEAEIFASVGVPYTGGRAARYIEAALYGLNLIPHERIMLRPFVATQMPDINWHYREWLFGFEVAYY
jgi:hypothetical protein